MEQLQLTSWRVPTESLIWVDGSICDVTSGSILKRLLEAASDAHERHFSRATPGCTREGEAPFNYPRSPFPLSPLLTSKLGDPDLEAFKTKHLSYDGVARRSHYRLNPGGEGRSALPHMMSQVDGRCVTEPGLRAGPLITAGL